MTFPSELTQHVSLCPPRARGLCHLDVWKYTEMANNDVLFCLFHAFLFYTHISVQIYKILYNVAVQYVHC